MSLKLTRRLGICIVLLLSFRASAQYIPYYTFTQNTSATYPAISSGTIVGSGTGLANQRYAVTLPFAFYLDNVAYTNIYIAVNGYISFGTTDPGAGYWMINASGGGFRIASGFDCDLASLNSTSEISYLTTGTSPNRVFIAQWKNMGYPATTVLSANFQIQLLEGSNEVKVVYGATSLGGATSQISVFAGLRGSNNGSWFSRSSATSSWTSTTPGSTNAANILYQSGSNPPSGLTYAFSPPLCPAPATQSTALALTPGNTDISVSFTASSSADKYLVVRTPNAPFTGTLVNGTTYAVNATPGNGVVVYNGTGTSFNNAGLTPGTYYTYTVFAYNDLNCVNGPVYRTATPLTGTAETIGPKAYTWQPTSGSGNFALASNWSPARVFTHPDDTLIFNRGGQSAATGVPGTTVKQIWVSNNTSIAITTSTGSGVTISDSLSVDSGSVLQIVDIPVVAFSTGAPVKRAHIDGTLQINFSTIFNVSNCNAVVNGTVSENYTNTGISASILNAGTMTFNPGSTYIHNRNGGVIPAAYYAAGSAVKVIGTTSSAPTIAAGQDFGNLEWNCPAQSASISLLGTVDTIRNNLSVLNSGGYGLALSGLGNNIVVKGNLVQQAGTLQLSPAGRLRILGDANLSAGALNLNTATGNATTFFLHGDLTQGSGHAITKSGTGIPGMSFVGANQQHIDIGGIVSAVDISYELNNAAGASLTGTLPVGAAAANLISRGSWTGTGAFYYSGASGAGGTLVYTSPFSGPATNVEWPALNGPYHVTVNKTAPAPDNRVYMPGNRSIPGTLTITKGALILNNYDLTVDGAFGNIVTPNDSTGIVAADSSGYLIRYVPARSGTGSTTYNFPVGDITGVTEWANVSLTIYSNAAARYIGVRLKDKQHPADTSTGGYLSRYWRFYDDGGSAACTYTLSLYHTVADIAGNANYRMARWDGAAWWQVPSITSLNAPTYAYTGVMTTPDIVSVATQPLHNNDFTGRPAINKTYYWTGALSNDYRSAGNWTPNRNIPEPTDRLVFNSGNTDTVKNIPAEEHLARLTFTNNTKTVFQSAVSVTSGYYMIFTDGDSTTNELTVDSGSALIMNGTLYPLRMMINNQGTTGNATVRIAGRIEISNTAANNYLNLLNAATTVTASGVLTGSGTSSAAAFISNGAGSAYPLTIYGTYEHRYTTTGGSIPSAIWAVGSNLNILGYTTATTFSGVNQPVYNLTYNCPNQTGNTSTGLGGLTLIAGTLNVISTGTGTWKIGNASAFNYTVNNYNQTGGNVDFAPVNASSSTEILNVTGDFIQNGGAFGSSATATSAPVISFNGTAGAQNVRFLNAAPVGRITYRINNPSGINLSGSGSLTGIFAINNGGGVQISSPVSRPINTSLTLQYNGISRLVYDAPGYYSADTICFPVLNGPNTLVINGGAASSVSLPFSRTVPGILQMTSGNLDAGANNLTLGTTTLDPGVLNYTGGFIQLSTGSFTRWFGLSGQPTAPGFGIGYFPVANAKGFERSAALYFSTTSAITNGGTISLSLKDSGGIVTGLSVVDGSNTISARTRAGWDFSYANGFTLSGATVGTKIGLNGLFNTNTPANLRVMYAGSVAGTHVTGSASGTTFFATRAGLSLANLAAATFYIGSNVNLSPVFISAQDGLWNAASTWNTGTVPTANDSVYISAGDTVTITAGATANNLLVNAGGTLMNSGNMLNVVSAITNAGTITLNSGTINLGPAGGGRSPFLNNGTLNVAGGNLNVNGSVVFNGTVNQSGGTIMIDGNDGTVAGSVNGDIVTINSSAMNLTGGSILIRDPNISAALLTIVLGANAGGAVSTNHDFILGDGISTHSGGDFIWYQNNVVNPAFKIGNLIINGSPSGTGRAVTAWGNTRGRMVVAGNVILGTPNAVLQPYGELYVGGNLIVNAGTTLKTGDGAIIFSNYNAGVMSPVTVPQTVSGTGVIFGTHAPIGTTFNSLIVNNTSAAGVSFNIGDFSFLQELSFMKGILNTNGAAIVQSITGNRITTPGSNTGWIVGKCRLPFWGTPSPNTLLFPVGDLASYTPVTINSTATSTSGYLCVGVINGDHAQISSSGIEAAKSINRYYSIDTNGWQITNPGVVLPFSMGAGSLSATFSWLPQHVDAGASLARFICASYAGSSWTPRTITSLTSSTAQVAGLGYDISGDYQIGEVFGAVAFTQQPASQRACSADTVSFSVTANATSYQWEVNSGAGWASLTNGSFYSGVASSTLLVVAPAVSLNNYQYRCKAYNSVDSATSSAATLQVAASVAPSVTVSVAPGTTICTGTPVTFTAIDTNGGTAPVYQWKVNGSNVGTNSAIYNTFALVNGDAVTCIMTSNAACARFTIDTSNSIVMLVDSILSQPSAITGVAGICGSSAQVYSVTPNGAAASYTWTLPSGWSGTSTSASVTASPATTGGTISVTASNSCGPSTARTLVVSVSTIPSQPTAISGSAATCNGVAQTYSVIADTSVTSYTWTLPSGWIGTAASNSITVTPGSTGGSMSVTGTNFCGTSAARTLAITGSAIPAQPSSITGATSVCSGVAQTYTVINDPAATTYNWTLPSGWSGTSTTNSITVTPNGTGGSIGVTGTNYCGTSLSRSLAVTANAIPAQPSAITGSASICAGVAQTYTIPADPNVTSYAWTIPSGWIGTSTSGSITVTPNSTGGSISVAGINSCGTGTAQTLSISITTLPTTPSAILGSTSVCSGTTQTYSVTADPNVTSYTWTLPSGWSGTGVTNSITATTGTASGTISVTGTNSCGTSPAATLAVTTTASVTPAVSIAATGGSTICAGTSVTFNSTVTNGGTSPIYSWRLNGSVAGTGTSYSNPALANNDSVTVTLTSSAVCASPVSVTSSAVHMTVNSLPAAPTVSTPVTYCQNASAVPLTATGSNLKWYTAATGGTASTTAPTPVTATPGTTNFWVSQTSAAGCEGARTQIAVTILPTPAKPTASGNTPVCFGDTLFLTATSTLTSPVYSWTGPGFSSSIQNPFIAGTTAAAAGIYHLTVSVKGCVSAPDSVVVVVSCLDSVWAGDANYDKVVDNTDALEIALAMGSAGPARATTSIVWQPSRCRDWATSLPSYAAINRKHADCDGDGTVGYSDTLAVSANYGLAHPRGIRATAKKTAGLPDLYFDLTGIIPRAGKTISVPIKLGTSGTSISNVAGIAARLIIDGVIPSDTPTLSYAGSWLGGSGNTLQFSKAINNSRVDWAYARTDQHNNSGSGTLAWLTFTLPAGAQGEQLHLYFDHAMLVDSGGARITQFNTVDDSIAVVEHNVGISTNTTQAAWIRILPNPSSGACYAQFSLPVAGNYSLDVTDLSGKAIWHTSGNGKAGEQSIALPYGLLSAGMYIVSLHSEGQIVPPVRWIKE